MKYELPQMKEGDFHEFHTFVQACFDEGRQRFHPELRRITTDKTGYSPAHEAYLKDTDSLAVTMEGQGDYQTKFDIWVNPSYYKDTPRFRATLAHELVHGYAGLKYGHNAHWRRWFYRVLWHLQKENLLRLSDFSGFVYDIELCYNQSSLEAGTNLLTEAAEKAEEEHTRVLDNYLKRAVDAASRNHL